MLGGTGGRRRRGRQRMRWLDGITDSMDMNESGWTPGVGDGQGGLACCDSWGRKESDMTEQLNWTELFYNAVLVSEVQCESVRSIHNSLLLEAAYHPSKSLQSTRLSSLCDTATLPTRGLHKPLDQPTTKGRDQKQEELWPYSPGKGDLKYSQLAKMKWQKYCADEGMR